MKEESEKVGLKLNFQKTKIMASGPITKKKKKRERDCPKKANKIPKICPRCHRGMHWAKSCKFKFDIDGKPIPKNSKQGTPQVPYNKNQGQILSFPSNPQHLALLLSIYQP